MRFFIFGATLAFAAVVGGGGVSALADSAPSKAGAAAPVAAVADGKVVFVGSDLLKGACSGELEKAASAAGISTLKLALEGSLMGEKYLRDSRASAAFLFLPDKAKVREIADGTWLAVPVAYQTIVIAVGRENKLERLELGALAQIFGARQGATLRSWSELAGSGLNLPVHPIATRSDASIATVMFRNRVLHDQDFRANTSYFGSDAETAAYLAGSPASVALLALPPHGEAGLRVIPLAADSARSAYLPTAENLQTGDYPLVVPLYLVVPRRSVAAVRPLLPVVLGDKFAGALQAKGFVPAEKKLRKIFQESLDSVR